VVQGGIDAHTGFRLAVSNDLPGEQRARQRDRCTTNACEGELWGPSQRAFTRSLLVLLLVLGSEVELETLAVLVIHPPAVPVIVVVSVKTCVAPLASEEIVHVTVDAPVHPGAETSVSLDGKVSVTTTFCAVVGPRFLTVNVQTAVVDPLFEPVFVKETSAVATVA
jgi:hypothetical protein